MDYQEIKKQFDQVLKHSQNLDSVNTDELFENWYAAKSYFIKGFGDKLIYEVEDIEVELSKEDLFNLVVINFIKKIRAKYDSYDIPDHFFKYIEQNYEDFATNILHQDWKISEEKTISVGMKFTKSFKYFITNEEILNDVQMTASMVTQQCKVSGTFCLSVHPLDYLSVSENCHQWRSCHALNGEYKSGNLSYMQDSSTIICYIKSKEGDTFVLPNFPEDIKWNSKKWRMLLFVSDAKQMIYAGRQYPFASMCAMNKAREVFLNLFTDTKRPLWWGEYEKDNWVDWQNYYIEEVTYPNGESLELYARYIPLPGHVLRVRDLITDVIGPDRDPDDTDPLHYNDLLRSSCYVKPYYSYFRFTNADPQHFTIGSAVKCVRCGKEYVYGEGMICEDCMDENKGNISIEDNQEISFDTTGFITFTTRPTFETVVRYR